MKAIASGKMVKKWDEAKILSGKKREGVSAIEIEVKHSSIGKKKKL